MTPASRLPAGAVAAAPAGSHTIVAGLDLSLTATGLATITSDGHLHTDTHHPGDLGGCERLTAIREAVLDWARPATLIVVEGPSYGSEGRGQHERAGLWWLIRHTLHRTDRAVAVVPPAVLKAYATGRGNASKDQMLTAAVRRLPGFDGDNNQADAGWLAAMGLDWLGGRWFVPDGQRAVLGRVDWPAFPGVAA